ncbi:hypothetical protein HJC23_001954 [Cyclotella cryptica]|uniref:Uncharacterized protein n=1 Tax=Cyclotella cryptica TaxID=29204 RepID=A0ABD3PQ00_9STRA
MTRRIRLLPRSLLLFTALLAAWTMVNFSVTFLESPLMIHSFISIDDSSANNNKAINFRSRLMYIPGAGFSGFFYTLGRLHSLHKNNNMSTLKQYDDEYYCFSAGCLALVATLMEVPLHSAIEMALSSRGRWRRGEIGRFDIVEDYVDRLLLFDIEKVMFNRDSGRLHSQMTTNETSRIIECGQCYHNYTTVLTNQVQIPFSRDNATNSNNQHFSQKIHRELSKIKIITTTWSSKNNINAIISQSTRSPSTLFQLKEMLLQTTHIPFVTGPTLGRFDASSGAYHNDGAFVSLLYGWKSVLRKTTNTNQSTDTSRTYSLKLPWDAELIFHGLNMALSREKAVYFWNRGLLRGI